MNSLVEDSLPTACRSGALRSDSAPPMSTSMAITEEVMGWGTQAFHEHKAQDKGIPPWSGTPNGSWMALHGTRSGWRGFFLPIDRKTRRACKIFCVFDFFFEFKRFSGTNFLNVRNTTPIWGNREIPWRRKWRSPQNGFVERILTQQHCAHRLKRQAWVVNPGKEGNNSIRNIPRPGWGKKDEKSKKGGRGANDRDKTCSKNWDTKKKDKFVQPGY